MKNSAEVVREGEGKLNRLNEFILFCKKMGWKKIGVSHCIAFNEQGELLTDYLKKNNFEVFRCCCKVYEIDKDEIKIPTKVPGKKEFSCNPCAQADILNEAGTDYEFEKINYILNERIDQRLPFVLVSNLSSEQLALAVGDRLADRIAEHPVLNFKWPSFRPDGSR